MNSRAFLRRTLCLVSIINLLGWGALWFLREKEGLHQGVIAAFRPGAGIPEGYLADHVFYGGMTSNDKCAVVRYVSSQCS